MLDNAITTLALVPTMVLMTGAPSGDCTSPCTAAPPPPSGAAGDWSVAVHPNCLSNLDRLARWTGGTTMLGPSDSPQSMFECVDPGSIASGASPQHVIVIVHGWAPGWRDAVTADPALKWWSTAATNGGMWASNWAWIPTSISDPAIDVKSNGLFQLAAASDPHAVVLGYSWLDNSATGGSYDDRTYVEVYQSAAYTTINGLRLASALEAALAPSFWSTPGNTLHLVGHSHGSKVATVATVDLQQRGFTVDHLTILDSPESELTLSGNGANLLGFHLSELKIADGVAPASGAVFVDNYVSRFGYGYAGSDSLNNIVEVMLDPTIVYSHTDPGDQHSYAAEWYGGAAAGAAKYGLPPIGFGWPPPPVPNTPALNQTWPDGATNASQWALAAGTPIDGAYVFSTTPLAITAEHQSGNVSFDADAGTLVIAAADARGMPTVSRFEGGYYNSKTSDGYGVGFQLDWTNPAVGDYVVVTVDSPERGEFGVQEVVLVLDGTSLTGDVRRFPMSFCADLSGTILPIKFNVHYVPAANNRSGQITLRDFRLIVVQDGATGEGPPRSAPPSRESHFSAKAIDLVTAPRIAPAADAP